MKLKITSKQWDEAQDKNIWRRWSYDNKYVEVESDGAIMPMPTIEQMLHFLEPLELLLITCVHNKEKHSWFVNGIEKEQLCDALWEQTKKHLTK